MQFCNLKLKPVVLLVASLFMNVAFAEDVVQTENVSVFGKGQTRQIQSINQKDMEETIPGTSPLKVLEKLPGVSFQSSDPFGAYEWSTRFGVRGFGQSYMGFTLDGVPLGTHYPKSVEICLVSQSESEFFDKKMVNHISGSPIGNYCLGGIKQ